MSFTFGGMSAKTTNIKHLSNPTVDYVIAENFNITEEDYYIFLLEQKPDNTRLKFLEQEIKKAGFKSYVILSAARCKFKKDDASLVEFYEQNESQWRSYITNRGKHCRAIMTFGAALYAINKQADLLPEHFLTAEFVKRYYYMGSGFIGNYDCFIFPTFSLDDIYPITKKGITDGHTWVTKWTISQLKHMYNDDPDYPDMQPYQLHFIDTIEGAKAVLEKNMNSELMSLDLETNSLEFFIGKIGCLTLCFDGINGYFIPWSVIEEGRLKRLLTACIESAKRVVGSNIKFDYKFLWKHGVAKGLYPTDSTDILSHAIHSKRSRGLKPLSYLYTYFGGYDYELKVFMKQTKIKNFLDVPFNMLYKYATLDAIVTWRTYKALRKQIQDIDRRFPNEKMPEWSMEKHYDQIMMPICRVMMDVEYNGFYVNKKLMDENRKTLYELANEQKKILAEELNTTIDFEFNSTKQLGDLLKKNGYPLIELSKDGSYSTSEECLKAWEKMGYKKVTNAITKMRNALVLIKTFLGSGDEDNPTGWQELMRYDEIEKAWRIFQSYFVMGTSTYRFIGKEPNLQQIPQHDKTAMYVKQVILPPDRKRYKMLTRDYSAFQTRLLAIDTILNPSGLDMTLKKVYEPGSTISDLHAITAHNLFFKSTGHKIYEVTDDNGKIWLGQAKQKIKTQRGEIAFRDLNSQDQILGYVE